MKKAAINTNVYNCPGLSTTYSASPSGCYPGGIVDKDIFQTGCSTKVKSLYANFVRIGGKRYDKNPLTYEQWCNAIDLVRSIGCEPIIQISTYNSTTTPSTTEATNLLTHLNTTKNKKIKYVLIGNEPDQYANYPTSGSQAQADYIAAWFKTYANALKGVDANIKIIGPCLSFYNAGVYAKLLDSNNPTASIVGSGSNGYYLDIVDIHRYPFSANSGGSWGKQEVSRDPADPLGNNFAGTVLTDGSTGLLDYIVTANSPRPLGSKLQFAMTEMNICWQNESNNTYTDESARSFIAGQWMAEMYCSASQTFNASATGGTAPYTYSWAGISGNTSSVGSSKPGTANTVSEYTVTVTDNNGCSNKATCSHYANHSTSITGPASVGYCCGLTLTSDHIPGATYVWKKNGTAISGATLHVLTLPAGWPNNGTYVVEASPGGVNGSQDPCSGMVSASKVVTTNSFNCNCAERPEARFMNILNEQSAKPGISEIIPNPNSGSALIRYQLAGTSGGQLIITNVIGEISRRYELGPSSNSFAIDEKNFNTGVYFITLLINGIPVDTRKMLITK